MEHASLDEIRTAIEAGLEAKGAEDVYKRQKCACLRERLCFRGKRSGLRVLQKGSSH